jgi:hypothetical protein
MIECYDEYLYAKVTLIFGMVTIAVPFLFVCIAAGICEFADWMKKHKHKRGKDGHG